MADIPHEPRAGPPAEDDPETTLADSLSGVARDLEDEGDLASTLEAIVHAAVTTVPGADHASITTVRGLREVTTSAASSELARASDRAQYLTREGPCLDSLRERRTARVADTGHEPRWPRFARAARDLGVGSLLSVQLYVKGDDLGALNLVSEQTQAFDDGSEVVALLFASHAAVAIVGAEKEDQLRDALSRRDIVGQAMGVVMERYDLSPQRAFSLLVRHSKHNNRRLLDLATSVVHDRDVLR